jgi:hypothetical protein
MRARWEALHAALDRSVRTLQAEQSFQQARPSTPRSRGFDQRGEVVEYLASKGGDGDEKDRLLAVLVTIVQRREHHELASGLLWLGLWPGLDAVYRRRQRNFRGQPDELIAELADVVHEHHRAARPRGGPPRGGDARAQHRARPDRSPPPRVGRALTGSSTEGHLRAGT